MVKNLYNTCQINSSQNDNANNNVNQNTSFHLLQHQKNAFINSIRSGVRTPCCGIINLVSKLINKEENNEKKKALTDVLNSTKNLYSYFDEIIEFATASRHNHPLLHLEINFKKIINEVIECFSAIIKDKNIIIEQHCPQEFTKKFIGDSFRIRQIIFNLISNAINYTNNDKVTITIKEDLITDNKSVMKIIIEDSGPGIPEDIKQYIFEPFCPINSNYNSAYHGFGFGLPLVKQYLVDLGGSIQVENREPSGSRFICSLPLDAQYKRKSDEQFVFNQAIRRNIMLNHNTEICITKKPSIIFNQHIHKLYEYGYKDVENFKILLIENDEFISKFYVEVLQKIGYDVDVAKNGNEATKMFNSHYDLFLVDFALNGVCGARMCEVIKSLPKFACTPVILLSDIGSFKRECIAAGADDFAVKSFSEEELQNLVDKWLLKNSNN
ncbi:MAG: ATP-binding protein [Gammaproteobacteria bacterium]|jgi:CheY-like chemotaxis protein